MSISQQDINMLHNEGHTIIEASLEQGYIVVLDYVLCMSGGKRWTETKQVRLTTHNQVLQYILKLMLKQAQEEIKELKELLKDKPEIDYLDTV